MSNGFLVAAEEFDDRGGWVLDSQFLAEMGAPYLLAHGLGRPVVDATTTVTVPVAGVHRVWVRTKDWVPDHHPGRFSVSVDGTRLDAVFGTHGADWSWQYGGTVDLSAGPITVVLHDLTGFDGRCDALYFTRDHTPPPAGSGSDHREWRTRIRGLPTEPEPAGRFDVVVVGGGVTGCAAALTAARLGLSVALLGDRPVLGGNASVEVGLGPRGEIGPLVGELTERTEGGDLCAGALLDDEPTATVFLEHSVFDVVVDGATIAAVDARESGTGRDRRFVARCVIDCSGTAIVGIRAGASMMFGRESRAEFGEGLAPERGDDLHHGNTLFFRTRMASEPVAFPDVPWATETAGDYADLGGQLTEPGVENGPGPAAGRHRFHDPSVRRRMTYPMTHFWEYGQTLDPYTNGERIRDHLLRAVYGTLANIKAVEPDSFAHLEFDWVAHVSAKGEYRRYLGDHVLTETEIREHAVFPDAVVANSGAFCLHYSGDENHDFRLKDWKWDERDGLPYSIPFRCLYSADVDNLMMAGKHISVTHIAGSSTKFMGNGGQHGIATAAAAALCVRYGITPREMGQRHLDELRTLVGPFAAQ
ncbi:FAD-dependent oxidoreductase [Gordonia sp. NPDC003376]